MRMKQLAAIILLIWLIGALGGCSRQTSIPIRMVTRITVDGVHHSDSSQRTFYESESIRKILLALRLKDQSRRPEIDPEALDVPEFWVTMTYANGQTHILRLKSDRYLKDGDGPWRQLAPESLAVLHYLLYFMPSDGVSDGAFPHNAEKEGP